jgi:hypothetical protein
MAPECSLREVHDVSQELQDKLETVEGFGRAFVLVDYGKPFVCSLCGLCTIQLKILLNFRNIAYARTPQNPLLELRVAMAFCSMEIVAIRLARQQNQLQSKGSKGTTRSEVTTHRRDREGFNGSQIYKRLKCSNVEWNLGSLGRVQNHLILRDSHFFYLFCHTKSK